MSLGRRSKPTGKPIPIIVGRCPEVGCTRDAVRKGGIYGKDAVGVCPDHGEFNATYIVQMNRAQRALDAARASTEKETEDAAP